MGKVEKKGKKTSGETFSDGANYEGQVGFPNVTLTCATQSMARGLALGVDGLWSNVAVISSAQRSKSG
jgi:hypothetical protein